jgi:hypothetical protein
LQSPTRCPPPIRSRAEIPDHRQVGHGATPSALGRQRRELPPLETANNELCTAEQPTSRR